MSGEEFLTQRIRDGILLDAYGGLLTEKQKMACEMVLLSDLSLAEAAETLGVSRQGVHDLVVRAKEHMEAAEASLGMLDKEMKKERMSLLLEENRQRLPEDFYEAFAALLKA